MLPSIDRTDSSGNSSAGRASTAITPDHPKRWRFVQVHVHIARDSRRPDAPDWLRDLADLFSLAPGIGKKELKLDMYDPDWHKDARTQGVRGENLRALCRDYDEVLAWRRQHMHASHQRYGELVGTWKTEAEAGTGLQATPPEVRGRILHACMAGETRPMTLHLVHTLALINTSWAALVHRACSQELALDDRLSLAEYQVPILWSDRDGVLYEKERVDGKMDDLLTIARRWGLPAQTMTPVQLQAFRKSQCNNATARNGPHTLDLGAALVWVPCEMAESTGSWSTLIASHGDSLRYLGIRIFQLNADATKHSLQKCPNVSELLLDDWVNHQNQLSAEQLKAQDYGILSRLDKLEGLEIPAAAIEKIPAEVLVRLRRLTLFTRNDSPAQASLLNGMNSLQELTFTDVNLGCQLAWLQELPPALQQLKIARVAALGELRLPASLRGLEVGTMDSASGLVLPSQLDELNLLSGADQERLDLACNWLEQAKQQARALRLGSVKSLSLAPLIDQLQKHCALEYLSLGRASWGIEDTGKLVRYITGNPRLSRLELGINLPDGDRLLEFKLILNALTACRHLRRVHLDLYLMDPLFAEALAPRMREWGRENPGLEWSCWAAHHCLTMANWPARLQLND